MPGSLEDRGMIEKVAAAILLLGATVLINALGLAVVFRRTHRAVASAASGIWPATWLLIRLACWVIAVHGAGIALWALFYWWQRCLPDFATALYFSVITYTTVGYGDVVLTGEWRLLSGVEALTGILMCGLSAAYFFAVVNRLHTLHSHPGE